MDDALTCESCAFWHHILGTTLGACDLQVAYGDPPFDYTGCMYHSQRDATPFQPETIDLQSQTRGPPWPNPGRQFWPKPSKP